MRAGSAACTARRFRPFRQSGIINPYGEAPFDCTSATPRSQRGVSLCRAGTLSLWLTRSAPCATIAIPSLHSLRVPSTAPSSPQGTISNTPQNCGVFAYEPAAPLRVAKMQAVHSLLVSPLHSETIALSLIFPPRGFPHDDNVIAERLICQGKGLERAGRKTAFGRDCSISRAHSVLTMRVREGKIGV